MVNQVNCVNIGNVVWASLYRIGRDIEAPTFRYGETHTDDYIRNFIEKGKALSDDDSNDFCRVDE